MKSALDSSRVFKQENYRGEIREVVLIGHDFRFSTLKESLDFAEEKGYVLGNLAIVNYVCGDSVNNEPLSAINLRRRDSITPESIDALIVQMINDEGCDYRFYENFRFLM